jgi:hypothetical protein
MNFFNEEYVNVQCLEISQKFLPSLQKNQSFFLGQQTTKAFDFEEEIFASSSAPSLCHYLKAKLTLSFIIFLKHISLNFYFCSAFANGQG